MSRRFPLSFYNPITLIGSAIAAVSFGLVLFLILLELMSPSSKPYMGVIAFVILPSFLIIGVGIAVAGILREHRRRRLGLSTGPHLPRRCSRRMPATAIPTPMMRNEGSITNAMTPM